MGLPGFFGVRDITVLSPVPRSTMGIRPGDPSGDNSSEVGGRRCLVGVSPTSSSLV